MGRKYTTSFDATPDFIGGFSIERRRHVPVVILPDLRFLVRFETAKNDFDVLGILEANTDFWQQRPDLGGWVSPLPK